MLNMVRNKDIFWFSAIAKSGEINKIQIFYFRQVQTNSGEYEYKSPPNMSTLYYK